MTTRWDKDEAERLRGTKVLARQDGFITADGLTTIIVVAGPYGTRVIESRGTDRGPEKSWQHQYLAGLNSGDPASVAARVLRRYNGLHPDLEHALTQIAEGN